MQKASYIVQTWNFSAWEGWKGPWNSLTRPSCWVIETPCLKRGGQSYWGWHLSVLWSPSARAAVCTHWWTPPTHMHYKKSHQAHMIMCARNKPWLCWASGCIHFIDKVKIMPVQHLFQTMWPKPSINSLLCFFSFIAHFLLSRNAQDLETESSVNKFLQKGGPSWHAGSLVMGKTHCAFWAIILLFYFIPPSVDFFSAIQGEKTRGEGISPLNVISPKSWTSCIFSQFLQQ